MSTDLPPDEGGVGASDPPDDDVLTAELRPGVLKPEQRLSAPRRSQSDRAFAQRVAHWEARLACWLVDIEPVAVPAHVWSEIRARLG